MMSWWGAGLSLPSTYVSYILSPFEDIDIVLTLYHYHYSGKLAPNFLILYSTLPCGFSPLFYFSLNLFTFSFYIPITAPSHFLPVPPSDLPCPFSCSSFPFSARPGSSGCRKVSEGNQQGQFPLHLLAYSHGDHAAHLLHVTPMFSPCFLCS